MSVLTPAALTLCPLHAGAQTPPPFVIESDHGDNRLQLGALVQFDGRFFAGDVDGLDNADTFLIRRLRPVVQGRVAKCAYIDTRFSNAFHVRVGKGKAPFGLERLQSVANLLFSERALPTTVAPDRDMQIEALGDLHGGLVSYAAAIGNGVVDGGADDVDGNHGKDLTGRLVVRPWGHHTMNPLSGLGLAPAGSYGTQPSLLPTWSARCSMPARVSRARPRISSSPALNWLSEGSSVAQSIPRGRSKRTGPTKASKGLSWGTSFGRARTPIDQIAQ